MNTRFDLPPLNENGTEVDMQEVHRTFFEANLEWFESKKDEFDRSLAKRCEEENEVYNNMGFDQRMQMHLYQVGLAVYGVSSTPQGIQYQIVGRMGQ